MRNLCQFAVLTIGLLASACATAPAGNETAELDRYEKTNRAIYKFNKGIDTAVIRPVAVTYRAVVPAAARRGATTALNNVDEPLTFINAILQGKVKVAFRAVDRFLINSTLGVGGLADHATDMGLPVQEEDFGQTLAVWGVGSGPYIMLPLFGPSTLRDAAGLAVDTVSDPWSQFKGKTLELHGVEGMAARGFEVIDLRSQLVDSADPILKTALDEYATTKSAYFQVRLSEIYDGDPPVDEYEPSPDEAVPDPAEPEPKTE